jgi:hypothetical protein
VLVNCSKKIWQPRYGRLNEPEDGKKWSKKSKLSKNEIAKILSPEKSHLQGSTVLRY